MKELEFSVREAYQRIVAEHGHLFEQKTLPMDEADRVATRRHRVIMQVVGLFVVFVLSSTVYLIWDGGIVSYLLAAVIGAMVIFCVMSYLQYEAILRRNTKEVLKGVLTKMTQSVSDDKNDYHFELSMKEMIRVDKDNYDRFAPGDIVEIQMLTGRNSLNMKRNIKKVGNILDK